MRYKACKNCMWWWDLYDTGERLCHRKGSPFYQKRSVNGCKKYEDLFWERKALKLGYYKKEE